MKKLWILLGAFVIFIGMVVAVQISLKNDVEWIEDKTEEIKASFDDLEYAKEIYDDLNERWEKRQTFWGMLLPHDNLQEISKEIKSLGTALDNSQKEKVDETIALITLDMQNLMGRNTLRWDHIF